MNKVLYILLIALYAFALFTALPYRMITAAEFDPGRHYAAWYNFPQERIDALTEATQPGTTIGFVDFPAEDRHAALWNPTLSNRVVKLTGIPEGLYCRLILTEAIPDYESTYPHGDRIVTRDVSTCDIPLCDYLYIRTDRSPEVFAYCNTHTDDFRLIYGDAWGILYEVRK